MADIGLAFCGSFCTLRKLFPVIESLKAAGHSVTPILSEAVRDTDTRFISAIEFRNEAERLCGCPVIDSIVTAEPIGPKKLFDVVVVAPCTGNTLAKLANSIADGTVTLACKAHLRNERPLVIGVSTNDALAGNAANIGKLLGRKHVLFVPFAQDDAAGKPTSCVADFSLVSEVVAEALCGRQRQPILC